MIREFLQRYNGSPLPREDIAANVLEDFGVPAERTAQVFSILSGEASHLGLTQTIKGKVYIDLSGAPAANRESPPVDGDLSSQAIMAETLSNASSGTPASSSTISGVHLRRVFVTHGKNREFVDPIRQLLQFGEMDAVVALERQSVSQPVPDKVMNEMRSCGAAIIHVDAEMRLIDSEAKEVVMLNPNVLIEIGAAMALYGRRFILLVREGVKLPSNLQGLFEVRYDGEKLDGNATIRLLQAINELKKEPPPLVNTLLNKTEAIS